MIFQISNLKDMSLRPELVEAVDREVLVYRITGASPTVRRALLTHDVSPPRARYRETIASPVADIKGSAAGDQACSAFDADWKSFLTRRWAQSGRLGLCIGMFRGGE